VDLDDGQIGVGVFADELGAVFVAVGEGDAELPGAAGTLLGFSLSFEPKSVSQAVAAKPRQLVKVAFTALEKCSVAEVVVLLTPALDSLTSPRPRGVDSPGESAQQSTTLPDRGRFEHRHRA